MPAKTDNDGLGIVLKSYKKQNIFELVFKKEIFFGDCGQCENVK